MQHQSILGNVHKWRPTFFGHFWPTYHVRRFLPYNVRYLEAFLDPPTYPKIGRHLWTLDVPLYQIFWWDESRKLLQPRTFECCDWKKLEKQIHLLRNTCIVYISLFCICRTYVPLHCRNTQDNVGLPYLTELLFSRFRGLSLKNNL